MKVSIPKYILYLTLGLLSLTDVFAQLSVSSSKSRLNIGKKNISTIGNLPKPSKVSVKPSTAINAYYRSLLKTPNIATSAASDSKTRHPAEYTITHSVEAISTIQPEITKAEDFFFNNDKVKVLNAFPNPASEYAQIDYSVAANGNAKITLYNVLGVQVSEYDLDKGDHTLRIQTRELPTGVYFYQLLLDGKKVATKKLLIRH